MRKGFLCSIDGTSPPLLPSIPPFQLSLRHSSLSLSSSVLHIRDASSLFFVLFSPALSSVVRLLEWRLPDRWVEEKLLVKAAYWPWSRRRVMSRLVVRIILVWSKGTDVEGKMQNGRISKVRNVERAKCRSIPSSKKRWSKVEMSRNKMSNEEKAKRNDVEVVKCRI